MEIDKISWKSHEISHDFPESLTENVAVADPSISYYLASLLHRPLKEEKEGYCLAITVAVSNW